ncbi:hypothetical protein B0J13DRAFT_588355 [Dactylonectria estremocensis]|uniref:Uncharacterized protein n=1 Tax=Dactylonectria estremocensis TaxID=1079267 RepID=A0A9P9E2B6_9HYPO|nr:hypothetical protein B0J13DRAFT_588355 [Dactylonectria estremocensis]
MYLSQVFVPSLMLLSQLVSAQESLDQICGDLPGIEDCKGTVTIPVKAKLKYCSKEVFTVDPCKTTTTFKYPCPTWKNPTKLCDGSTCVPGTVTKSVDVPCGISIVTKEVSLCQSVRDSVGNAGSDFINKASAMCDCIPKVLKLIQAGIMDTVFGAGVSLDVDSSVVAQMVRLQTCVSDTGLGIKDNRDEVYANELTSKDGWIVLHAAEITLATYAELALAVSPCLTGVACRPTAVANFFKRYLTDSATTLGIQLAKLLFGWIDIFGNIKKKVTAITDAAESLAMHLAPVPGKVQTTKKKICQNKRCVGPGVSAFMKKVSKALTTAQSLQNIRQAADTAATAAPEMISVVKKTIGVAKTIPGSSFFTDLIKSGALTKVEDMLESFQIVKELPESVAELEETISPVEDLVSNYEALGINALAAVEDVISFSWAPYAKELKADSSGKLRKGLIEIQKLFKTGLLKPVRDLKADIKGLKDVLATSPIKKGDFEFKAGITDYQRWTTLSMDAPCAKEGKSNFELSGFKTSFSYPKFYSCKYGPQEIPWPSHFVPYIKFKMAE